MSANADAEHRTAIEALYLSEEKRLFNVVLRWVWNETDAMDIVQDSFVRLWSVREKLDPTTTRAYLYRIALNQAANGRRFFRLKRFVGLDTVSLAATQKNAEKIFQDFALQKDVASAIDALPEALRSVLVMSEVSDLSYDEIGSILGIPSGTVGSRRNRALTLLRKHLEKWK